MFILKNKIPIYLYKYKKKLRVLSKPFAIHQNSNYFHSIGKQLNILFFGNDNFSLQTLKQLTKEKQQSSSFIKNLSVVTSSKSKIKTVEEFAKENQLKCLYWPITSNDCREYDIGVVTSFGHLIPEKIISAFSQGMINVHGSLLPRWRGAAPTIYALMHGDQRTGVTIMNIKPKHFDIGEILAQKEVPIGPNTLLPELNQILAKVGAELLIDCLRRYPLKGVPQSDAGVTYAPRVHPSLGQINWTKLTAQEVYNLYRALYSFQPVTGKWQNQIIKFLEITLAKDDVNLQLENSMLVPGQIVFVKKERYLLVCCADHKCIGVHRLKLGAKAMSASDFSNGFLKKASKEFQCFT